MDMLQRLFGTGRKTAHVSKADAQRKKVSLCRRSIYTIGSALNRTAAFFCNATPFTYNAPEYREYMLVQRNELDFREQLQLHDAKMRPILSKRAATFGVLDSEVAMLLDEMISDLLAQYRRWTNEDFLLQVRLEVQRLAEDEHVMNKDKLLQLQQDISGIGELRPLLMGDLILKKLDDRCTEDEIMLLEGLQRFDSFRLHISEDFDRLCPADGLYCDSHKSIRLVLMGKDSWDDLCSYAQHEFTHFLNHERYFLPVIRNWYFLRGNYMQPEELASLYLELIDIVLFPLTEDERSLSFLRKDLEICKAIRDAVMDALRALLIDLPEMSQMQENLYALNEYFSLFSILDESLAYLSERLGSQIYDSNALAEMHATVADKNDFKLFYNTLAVALKGKDQKEFDESCMQLCATFIDTWNSYPLMADREDTRKYLRARILSLC
ncbi:hypothetical protein [Methanomethylovorans sp.]|uniref:hypothetical protein n=1 Tax=Methanomethylovorans sp. TaxID=2758717 RepID=UPI002FDE4205